MSAKTSTVKKKVSVRSPSPLPSVKTRTAANATVSMKQALRTSERAVVAAEIKVFEVSQKKKTVGGGGIRDPSSLQATGGAATTAAASNRNRPSKAQLWGSPFAPAEQRSLLSEALRVQEAARWLAECPRPTLRRLQQRVLCASEAYFSSFAGLPSSLQQYYPASAGGVRGVESGNDSAVDEVLSPPMPLAFTTFLSEFALEHPHRRGDGNEVNESVRLVESAVSRMPTTGEAVCTRLYVRSVLATGRQQPVATQASVNLVYSAGVAEDIICFTVTAPATEEEIEADQQQQQSASNENNNNNSNNNNARKKLRLDYMESDQVLMSEIAQWSRFFATFFDEALEGQCRDPISLFTAILLGCALKGVEDADASPEAELERTVAHLRSVSKSTRHAATCSACGAMLAWQEEHYRYCIFGDSAGRSSAARAFLGTAAVTLWVEAFLQLNRMTASSQMHHHHGGEEGGKGAEHEEGLPVGEVYFIRDWLRQLVRLEERCFKNQQRAATTIIPLSCRTRSPCLRVAFSTDVVEAAIADITAWADACVQAGTPLSVRTLVSILKEGMPVFPYYMTFFSAL